MAIVGRPDQSVIGANRFDVLEIAETHSPAVDAAPGTMLLFVVTVERGNSDTSNISAYMVAGSWYDGIFKLSSVLECRPHSDRVSSVITPFINDEVVRNEYGAAAIVFEETTAVPQDRLQQAIQERQLGMPTADEIDAFIARRTQERHQYMG